MKIDKILKEILVGKLLGDAHLETQNEGKTYRLKIEHSLKQKEYVDWLYEKLKDFCVSFPKIRTRYYNENIYYKYFFNTKSVANLVFLGKQFYQNKKKVVPKIIRKLLTPLSVAVWFMDDGSIKSHETNGRIFNTQGFTKKEVQFLSKALNSKFGLHSYLRKQKDGWQIFIPAEDAYIFRQLIQEFVLPYFYYKLPKIRLTTLPKE